MSPDLSQLPPDLRDTVATMVAGERAEKERLQAENRILREMIRLLHLKKYGPRSEQLSDRQLQFLEGEPCVTPEEVAGEADRGTRDGQAREPRVPKRDRAHPGRVELPAHLERRIEVIPVPPDQCRCPRCRKDLPLIGIRHANRI